MTRVRRLMIPCAAGSMTIRSINRSSYIDIESNLIAYLGQVDNGMEVLPILYGARNSHIRTYIASS